MSSSFWDDKTALYFSFARDIENKITYLKTGISTYPYGRIVNIHDKYIDNAHYVYRGMAFWTWFETDTTKRTESALKKLYKPYRSGKNTREHFRAPAQDGLKFYIDSLTWLLRWKYERLRNGKPFILEISTYKHRHKLNGDFRDWMGEPEHEAVDNLFDALISGMHVFGDKNEKSVAFWYSESDYKFPQPLSQESE